MTRPDIIIIAAPPLLHPLREAVMITTCACCGQEFESKRADKVLCSAQCRPQTQSLKFLHLQ
jgi:hypothetical protein